MDVNLDVINWIIIEFYYFLNIFVFKYFYYSFWHNNNFIIISNEILKLRFFNILKCFLFLRILHNYVIDDIKIVFKSERL